ncbi:hypothetical protein LZ023_35860 (plasmid) [Pseudomonas silvicola]|nr:hypothetical protein LZ023_35860 [Pseudomonas silvicola]
MRVQTQTASWTLLTPGRALWLPGSVPHALTALSDIRSASLYLDPKLARAFWPQARSMLISPLLQVLMQTLVEIELQPQPDLARVDLISPLLLDEISPSDGPVCNLPLPSDRRLLNICQQLLATPASGDTLEEWGQRVGASSRTLARLFRGKPVSPLPNGASNYDSQRHWCNWRKGRRFCARQPTATKPQRLYLDVPPFDG